MYEKWYKLSLEFEKWGIKYINLQNEIEGKVYHYTNSNELENILKNKALWVSKSDFLNDKTEYIYAINLINKLYDSSKYKYIDKAMLVRIKKKIKTYLSRSYILSTSQNGDSISLWSNYSECEGYNIGFNLNKIYDKLSSGKNHVTGNKVFDDGSIKKYEVKEFDQYKSIAMSAEKVIYDYKIQRNVIIDILNFLEYITNTYYLYAAEIDETEKQGLNITII